MIKIHKIKSMHISAIASIEWMIDPDPINNNAFESAHSSPIHWNCLQVLTREDANPKNA